MGKPRWYKFSILETIITIVLVTLFIVSSILLLTDNRNDLIGALFIVSMLSIPIFISTHFIVHWRDKKIGEGLIAFRKKFLFLYSSLNVFDTEWGLLSFGDKVTINYGDKTITGYLSVVTDYVQIVDKKKMIVLIDKKEITSITNEGDYSFNNESVREAKQRWYRINIGVKGRHMEVADMRYYNIMDSFSPYIEIALKNRSQSFWERLNEIDELSKNNNFYPSVRFNARSKAYGLQEDLLQEMIAQFKETYEEAWEQLSPQLNRNK